MYLYFEAVLHEYVHLTIQQVAVITLVNYVEGKVTFPPTYKNDLFSDDCDTSEECSTPAWTDEVLFHKQRDQGANPNRVAYYGWAELKQGNYRPVMAFIAVDILHADMGRTRAILEEV